MGDLHVRLCVSCGFLWQQSINVVLGLLFVGQPSPEIFPTKLCI